MSQSVPDFRPLRLNRPGQKNCSIRTLGNPGIGLSLLLLTFLSIEGFVPMRTALQIGADEGFELAKATLCVQGHRLYTEVWNDQPPLHTFLVTQILKHVSGSVLGPRLLTVGFSVVLLVSTFVIARQVNGALVASLATGMIIASPGFIELSSSCMLEIPALATALAAIALLCGGTRGFSEAALKETEQGNDGGAATVGTSALRLLLAGAVFGLGLQVKLVPIIYLPLAALIVLVQGWGKRGLIKRAVVQMALFAAGLVLAYVGSDLVIEQGDYLTHFGQSWKSHFGAVKASVEYGSPNQHPFDWIVLVKNWDVTVPAMIGVGVLITRLRNRQNKRDSVWTEKNGRDPAEGNKGNEGRKNKETCALRQAAPLMWLGLTFAVFGIHKPWWAYYYLHTAIPMCWCSAVAIGWLGGWIVRLLERERYERRRKATLSWFAAGTAGLFAVCSGGWMGARVYFQVANLRSAPKIQSTPVIVQLQRFRPYVQWLYADKLVYSFHSGIPVVPTLAVMPVKRLWSGELDNAGIRSEINGYKPGVLVLLNDGRDVSFKDLLDEQYQLIYMDSDNRMYLLKKIAKQVTSTIKTTEATE